MAPPDLGYRSEDATRRNAATANSSLGVQTNKPYADMGVGGDVRSSPPLAAPSPIRRPYTSAHRISRLGGPASASSNARGKASERGWASNAHEAGVPSGGSLGRNLRSKTRWFTGFCNSHHVSHFATFFIDARAEISVAESHIFLFRASTADATPERGIAVCLSKYVFLGVILRRIPTHDQHRPEGAAGQGRWGPRRRVLPDGFP